MPAQVDVEQVNAGWVRVPCPLCGATACKTIRVIRCELFGTDATAALVACNDCGLIRTDPQPRGEALAAYYATDDYYTHIQDDSRWKRLTRRLQLRGPLAAARLWAEEHTDFTRYAKRFLPKYFRPWKGRLLDYGCGEGKVAATFNEVGMQAVGIEPDAKARAIAAARGVTVYATLDECPASSFDRIVVRHVLEHVDDPVGITRHLGAASVGSSGRMLISVPNAKSHQAAAFDEHWIGWDVPRHLWHFTTDTLCDLVTRAGLVVDHITTVELKAFAKASSDRFARRVDCRLLTRLTQSTLSKPRMRAQKS